MPVGEPGAPLSQRVALAFSRWGALARHDLSLVPREAQQRLAEQVALAIEQRGTLVAEAGTGVGKTFGYLVPLLLSGRRALVSTATKNLQDQLFLRDLPRLCEALQLPLRLALLKGRSSYLCLQRLHGARASGEPLDRWTARALARIETWAQTTRSGDLAEVEGLDERSPLLALVSSTRDNCLGGECPQFRSCHVMHARRDAMAADLVVVNHHLFFADVALRDGGVAELLPSVDVAVVAIYLLAIGVQQARGLRDWTSLAHALEQAARQLRLCCAGPHGQARGGMLKLRWEDAVSGDGWADGLQAVADAAQSSVAALDALQAIGPDFVRLAQRAQSQAQLAEAFALPA